MAVVLLLGLAAMAVNVSLRAPAKGDIEWNFIPSLHRFIPVCSIALPSIMVAFPPLCPSRSWLFPSGDGGARAGQHRSSRHPAPRLHTWAGAAWARLTRCSLAAFQLWSRKLSCKQRDLVPVSYLWVCSTK